MDITPRLMKVILNLYPPYLGTGIRVTSISPDWREIRVSMSLRWYNRNAVGTHFGGSLYAMVDPHLMLMLMQLLGKSYMVWDQAAEIKFIKAGRTSVSAVLAVTDEDLEQIKRQTEDGQKYFARFPVLIHDREGLLVARVQKTIYVRKKRDEQ
jgi:acyl-coenzyme A thioesterase PaaI-like protein